MLLLSISPAASAPHKLTDADLTLVDKTRAIHESADTMFDADWLKKIRTTSDEVMQEAQAVYDEAKQNSPILQHAKVLSTLKENDSQYQTLVFVSYSLGRSGLNDVLSAAAGRDDTAVVMRGIPEGMNVWAGMEQIQQLAATMDPMPNVILDPTLFKKYDINNVPTIISLSQNKDPIPELNFNPLDPKGLTATPDDLQKIKEGAQIREIARVEGLSDPTWLDREIEAGRMGHLGVRGPVEEIDERDLIDVMKERVAGIDWGEKREQAQKRYWLNQSFIELPRTPKSNTRLIDASVVATKDIQTSDGQFVARAGDRVNPLATRAWTQAVIVFDPVDTKQIEVVKQEAKRLEADPTVGLIVYIATRFEKENGWDFYKSITDSFNKPVYQLTPDVKTRFELRYTPSVITANDTHFIVNEVYVKSDSETEN